MVPEILDTEINGDGHLPEEGWYAVEVQACTQKRSRRGADYYNLKLVDPETQRFLAYDVCVLQGKGNGIGLQRLRTLGVAQRNEAGTGWKIDPPQRVEGLRAYAYLVHEQYDLDGEQRTRCKVSIRHGACGYCTKDHAPEDVLNAPRAPSDEIPF